MAYRERDRIERRRWDQEQEAEQKLAEERRLAPIRKAEAELQETARKLRAAERGTALNGKEDPTFVRSLLSDPMKTIRLENLEEANEYNLRSAHAFMAANPEYHQSQANADLIANWCMRNDVVVFDAETLGNIVGYLDGLALIEHRSEPQPEPVIEQAPAPAPVQQNEAEGVDDSGRLKLYSKAEIDRMSADEYKRYFRIPTKAYLEYEEKGAQW
jgi:hypothetical protein